MIGPGNADGSFWLFVNFQPLCLLLMGYQGCPFPFPLGKGLAIPFTVRERNLLGSANGIVGSSGAFLYQWRPFLVVVQVKGVFLPACVGSDCVHLPSLPQVCGMDPACAPVASNLQAVGFHLCVCLKARTLQSNDICSLILFEQKETCVRLNGM